MRDDGALAIQRRDDGRWVPPGVYKNMRLGVVKLAFRCRLITGQAHATSEAKQVAWLTVDEARHEMVEAGAVRTHLLSST